MIENYAIKPIPQYFLLDRSISFDSNLTFSNLNHSPDMVKRIGLVFVTVKYKNGQAC